MEAIEELDLERGWQTWRDEGLKGGNDSLMSSMREKLDALPETGANGAQKCTIFRVPEIIRKSKPHYLFDPVVVSIGPYHRDKKHLHAMEEKKWQLLRDFLARAKNTSLETYITEMRALEEQARRCYNETIYMDSNSFIEMMILDGSFILQYLFYENIALETRALYEDAGWINSLIISNDLIMIENQIPFFILERMYLFFFGQAFTPEDMASISGRLVSQLVSTKIPPPPKKIYHLLHLCHHYIVPAHMHRQDDEPPINPTKPKKKNRFCFPCMPRRFQKWIKTCLLFGKHHKTKPNSCRSLPCATELQAAGIRIKKKKLPCDFTDITFRSGVLEIPVLHIEDSTIVSIMNLVAVEQGFREVPKLISTYSMFFDALVNTANDVMILDSQGIIDNLISGEEAVALYFNQSGLYVTVRDDHFLVGLFKKINEYCEYKKHRYRAKLMRDYFSNPWSMLSLAAAVFLLLLTSTQTFYSALSYHRPPQ